MIRSCLAFTLAASPFAAPAQSPERPGNFVALGVAVVPDYAGSDDYEAAPLPLALWRIGPTTLEVEGSAARLDLSPYTGFGFGPAARYRAGRDGGVEDDRVARLPNVDAAVEIGGFARYGRALGLTSADEAFVRLDLLYDVADGHGGGLATLTADYTFRPVPRLGLTGMLSTTLVTDDYAEAHFSIDERASGLSGLRRFDAGGGFRDVTLGLIATYAVQGPWGVVGIASVGRLVGDAADSPVTDDAGSATQFTLGVAVSYAF